MITITLMSATRARITGKFDDKKLDAHFAFCKNKFWWRSPAARTSGWDGKTHLFQRGPGTLPVGLVRTACKWLKKQGHKVRIVDERKLATLAVRKEAPAVSGITLRDDQVDAVLKAIKAERGVIHGATGSGKTAVAAAIIKQFGFPCTLFLTHRKKLARQTREAFASYFGKTADAVGLIQGGKWEHGDLPVYIAVMDTLTSKKFEAERRWLNKACSLLFLDEAHHAGSTTWYRTAQHIQARYRYGLTGTPVGRSDAGDLYLRACCGGTIARIRARDLIAKGILAKPTVYFFPVTLPDTIGDLNLPWATVYHDGIVHNAERNRQIIRCARACQRAGRKTLVLVRLLDHGAYLESKIESSIFVHGQTPDDVLDRIVEVFDRKKDFVQTVIATTIFDEGIDIPTIDALILAGGGKSPISMLQRIGRGLRRKEQDNRLFVFDFFDRTNLHLETHSQKRMDVCRREGFKTRLVESGGPSVARLLGKKR